MAAADRRRQLVARARSGADEAIRDRVILEWITRFRFVDAEVLALRFDVSKQQISARMRRLEAVGLIERKIDKASASWTIATTRKGARAIGHPPRRSPRTTIQREHELAIANLAARLEQRDRPPRVLTERECRRLEATTDRRYSADIIEPGRGQARRWPDLVLEHENTRSAVELERTAMGTVRLGAIVAGYADALWFDRVVFITAEPSIAARLRATVAATGDGDVRELFPSTAGPVMQVVETDDLPFL